MQGLSMVVGRWSMVVSRWSGGGGIRSRRKGQGGGLAHNGHDCFAQICVKDEKCPFALSPYIDDLLSGRVRHLPTVTGFGSVIAGIVVRIREGLLAWRTSILFQGTERIVMDELALLQFGANGVIDALSHFRRIGCPLCRTFGFPFGARAVLAEQHP